MTDNRVRLHAMAGLKAFDRIGKRLVIKRVVTAGGGCRRTIRRVKALAQERDARIPTESFSSGMSVRRARFRSAAGSMLLGRMGASSTRHPCAELAVLLWIEHRSRLYSHHRSLHQTLRLVMS